MDGICGNYYNFNDINFGLEKRPTSEITLEKHVKELIVTAGTIEILNTTEGLNENLVTSPENWKFAMDEEAQASGRIDVLYEYKIKNIGEEDYVSNLLAEQFDSLSLKEYLKFLKEKAIEIRADMENNIHYSGLGTYLGSTYYTGDKLAGDVKRVATHVLEIEDYINKKFIFSETAKTDFEETKESKEAKENGENLKVKNVEVSNIVKNRNIIKLLPNETEEMQIELKTNFSAEQELIYESYVAQIIRYANAVGRMDKTSIPDNVSKIDKINDDEKDESKAETIEIEDI